MAISLADRVVIVTGAGSGIGRATAQLAALRGAHVIIQDISEAGAYDTVKIISDSGGAATASIGDASNQADIDATVELALQTGDLRGLVNNAGIMDNFAPAARTTDETWERVMRINVDSVFKYTRAVIPHLIENGGGSIVNLASAAGIRGAAAGAAYTASKHAIVGLTRNTAYVHAGDNVRTNAVAPGGVETNVMAAIDPSSYDAAAMEVTGPVHATAVRSAQPDELAQLIVFLLTDAASNINGAIIPSDGGWSAA
ncbi:SDR family NAD(P)-dependent oxidoreductase [Enteractinococcus helveticum]|uniref:3-ketoacyl-ACP reductase n=1 Tax=Enteractinococcus helveticum TaxID=1837282 RepID=A0A1B7LZY5_9MICC|nr:SDR family oxidoreductase [Enteractinococcus helveticum]OAV61229.1 3-ketoacyl-ACP reductase [Enteractinococcus helveticum]